MGNQLVWQDRFDIGVDVIDREHRKLFSIMNRLLAFSEQEDKMQWVCQEGLKYFKDHAMKHFAEEEVYMASISYKGYESHRRIHDNFRRNTLPALERELQQSNYSGDAISHFLSVCAGWLIGHTLTEDHAIAQNETSRWVNLMPEEEQFLVKQTIIRRLHEMFGLDTQAVSECYGAERFGSGIYYRLIYGSGDGMQREIILVFEEKLLIHTMGKLLADSSGRLSAMLLNAARYTARQFVESIRKRFPSMQQYQMERENLLTYEQFQQVYECQLPQYSLLFDTGEGYFAYCAMTPRQRKRQSITRQEYKIAEINKYLNAKEQDDSRQKRKLLVVDDSDTVRLAMKGLLEEDYRIDLADSGASAIRSMTLERPDLILLDYDMPVCDGAQVLWMIREEKEFADIPVFFLTGKVDKESVNKVLPLKPEGYLLKSSKPAEIKKNIDRYFERKGK